LLRYLAGASNPALPETILAHTVTHDEPAGQVSKLSFDEKAIVEPHRRIPRVTNAVWKHADGTVASLIHVVGLHVPPYHAEVSAAPLEGFLMCADAFDDSLRSSPTAGASRCRARTIPCRSWPCASRARQRTVSGAFGPSVVTC
jgi:hypothetical protein